MFTVNINLTRSKLRTISVICADIAQVFFALFAGSIALPVDAGKLYVVILYLLVSILFWYLSIIFGDKGKI